MHSVVFVVVFAAVVFVFFFVVAADYVSVVLLFCCRCRRHVSFVVVTFVVLKRMFTFKNNSKPYSRTWAEKSKCLCSGNRNLRKSLSILVLLKSLLITLYGSPRIFKFIFQFEAYFFRKRASKHENKILLTFDEWRRKTHGILNTF